MPDRVLANARYKSCVRQREDRATKKVLPHLIDGPSFQNNGDVMIAAVVFSPDVAEEIADSRYWDARELDRLLPSYQNLMALPDRISMPHAAVSLKLMFWPVRGDSGKYTPLPLWDSMLNPDQDVITVQQSGRSVQCEVYAGFESKNHNDKLWKGAVALNAGLGPLPQTATASYLGSVPLSRPGSFGLDCNLRSQSQYRDTITYSNVPTANLDRFYTVRFTKSELDAMDPCDRALLDQSAYWSYGRAFDSGDALAMIAMHVMTKEMRGWTFQSAWWFNDARTCPNFDNTPPCRGYGKARPSIPDGAWKNYLMVTTYGITQDASGQSDKSWPPGHDHYEDLWPVAYNPYIELAVGHPIETNCMNCHRRAAWPNRVNASRRFLGRKSAYLAPGTNVPGLLDLFLPNDRRLFPGLVEVDSLWTISDRAYYSPREEAAAAH